MHAMDPSLCSFNRVVIRNGENSPARCYLVVIVNSYLEQLQKAFLEKGEYFKGELSDQEKEVLLIEAGEKAARVAARSYEKTIGLEGGYTIVQEKAMIWFPEGTPIWADSKGISIWKLADD